MMLIVLLCLQYSNISVSAASNVIADNSAVSGNDVSNNAISGGDIDAIKEVTVSFDTTYSRGKYKHNNTWNNAEEDICIEVEKDSDFQMSFQNNANAAVICELNGTICSESENIDESWSVTIPWSALQENNQLTIVFLPKFNNNLCEIVLQNNMGTYGTEILVELQYSESVQDIINSAELIWKCDDLVKDELFQDETAFLKKYVSNTNDTKDINICVEIWYKNVHIGTVQSPNYHNVEDDECPIINKIYYAVDEGDLVETSDNLKIYGSKTCIFKIEAEDVIKNNVLSRIRRVQIHYDNTSKIMQYDREESCYVYELNARAYEVYENVYFTVEDYAGNKIQSNNLFTVILDASAPECSVALTAGEEEIDEWYSCNGYDAPLSMDIEVKDHSQIDKIEISSNSAFTDAIVYDDEIQFDDVSNTYKLSVKNDSWQSEQLNTYYIRATDQYNNVSETAIMQIKVDNTAPSETVRVIFSGAEEMDVHITGESVEANTYVIEKAEGYIGSKEKINLEMSVEDICSSEEAYVSGVKAVNFELSITYKEDNSLKNVLVQESRKVKNGKISYTIDFLESISCKEFVCKITNIEIIDNAGNRCPAHVANSTDSLNDNVLYVLDNQSPVVEYKYESENVKPVRMKEKAGEITYYYDDFYEGIVNVSDVNLEEDTVTVNNADGYSKAKIEKLTSKIEEPFTSDMGNCISYTFKLEEGVYRLVTEADDLFQNNMQNDKMQTKHSHVMVVDKTIPTIGIVLRTSSGQSIDNYNNQCFKENMVLVVTITDVNLDIETLNLTINGRTDGGEEVYKVFEAAEWSGEGGVYTCQYSFDAEGEYNFSIYAEDFSGNFNTNGGESFYIDKTAPQVALSYDNNDAHNTYYYPKARTATITVTDYTFLESAAEIQITSQEGNQPEIGVWSHDGKGACDGEKHTRDCIYTVNVSFTEDDVYDVAFWCEDRAGSVSEKVDGGHFVIDGAAPIINITYEQANEANGTYFNVPRRTKINVNELSFSEELMKITKSGEQTNNLPALQHDGNSGMKNNYSMLFDIDGKYCFSVEVEDLAGNKAEVATSEYFIIDQTPPELSIEGVAHLSANNGVVEPEILYRDVHLDDTRTLVELETVKGEENNVNYMKESVENGYHIMYEDFRYSEDMDDLYVLSVTVYDLAGNETQESIEFSVNRFGSVFVLGEKTKQLMDSYYISAGADLVITEINVDHLMQSEISYSLNGEIYTLVEGKDYFVEKEGTESTWKTYRYLINKSNFDKEGYYTLTVSSTDKANNVSDNRVKNVEVQFAVDKTEPSIVVAGLEANTAYDESSISVNTDVKDNMCIDSLSVYVDNELLYCYGLDVLSDSSGIISFDVEGSAKPVDITILAKDYVGNESKKEYKNVVIRETIISSDALWAGKGYVVAIVITTAIGAIGTVSGGAVYFNKRRK